MSPPSHEEGRCNPLTIPFHPGLAFRGPQRPPFQKHQHHREQRPNNTIILITETPQKSHPNLGATPYSGSHAGFFDISFNVSGGP